MPDIGPNCPGCGFPICETCGRCELDGCTCVDDLDDLDDEDVQIVDELLMEGN